MDDVREDLPVIDVQNLSKSFHGQPAVVDVSLKIKRGEIFGFLGPNGGGKTTTIRLLCGLLTPDTGFGTCLGYDLLREADKIKMNIGYMTQKFSLYDELTVYENLDFMARLYAIPNRRAIVSEAITELGLHARAKQLVGTLSGGWKQRLSLSAALLHKPKLLLLDEPTAGVDPRARREFWEHISELSSRGITTLVSTHYMDEAERCNSLSYILRGKILARGTKEEIIAGVGLTTWSVSGVDVYSLAKKMKDIAEVEQVAIFGNELHISGRDAEKLHAIVTANCEAKGKCTLIATGLEDAFISLGSDNGK